MLFQQRWQINDLGRNLRQVVAGVKAIARGPRLGLPSAHMSPAPSPRRV
jgi:hypothetical protein